MKTSKTISLTCALLMALMILLPVAMDAQTVNPKGYWRFELPNPLDNTANPAFPVWSNNGNLTIGNTAPILGSFFESRPLSANTPYVQNPLDSLFRDQQFSAEFWIRFAPGHRRGSIVWPGRVSFTFEDNVIHWYVYTNAPGNHGWQPIYLNGTGASDPQSIYDGQWHHFAFTFDLCLLQQKVYLDGVCPQGWTRIIPSGNAAITDGADFFFGTVQGSPYDWLNADLDELAVYDTVLTPEMVYQHYQDVVGGNPYNFMPTFAGPVPMPSNTSPFGYDPMEFAAGYPNVPERPLQLFNKYPLPRYPVNDSMHRNLPFMADLYPFDVHAASTPQSSREAANIMVDLALDWNHMLFAGISSRVWGYIDGNLQTDNTRFFHHMINYLDSSRFEDLPRYMPTYWHFTDCHRVDNTWISGNYLESAALPDSFYIKDAFGVPLPDTIYTLESANPLNTVGFRLSMLARDGRYHTEAIRGLVALLQNPGSKHIDMLHENDEVYPHVIPGSVLMDDADIFADYTANSVPTWEAYFGQRLLRMRQTFRSTTYAYLDSLNSVAGRDPVQDIWYNTKWFNESYTFLNGMLRFNDGLRRPDPEYYPNEPARWRHGTTLNVGLDAIVVPLAGQLASGDKLFIPGLAPGVVDQSSFMTTDIAMLRPGQYLGILKAMGALGADAYSTFSWWQGTPDPPNWRTWWMPMAGYAQAAMTRAKPFLYNGKVLEGDIASITSLSVTGTATTYYTFSTGNVNDLVVGRQLSGQNKFLITASAQRLTNAPGVTPRVKDITFRLRDTAGTVIFQQLQIEERLQGSTYILDLNNPSAPVMTQIDRWHEWKEPSRWCRDFDFEAEVHDSITGTVTTATERPAGAAAGDFREFTTFVNVASPSDILGYRFRPRGSDQDTLHFWARVRNNSGSAQTLTVQLDNGPSISALVPAAGGWQWVGSQSFFHVVDTTWHWLFVKPSSDSLDFDLVTLKRSPDDFAADTFKVSATADTVCLGDTTHFRADIRLPAGCIDFHWDFGDGRSSYETDPVYVYPYPGTYEVVFTAWHACLDSTVADTIQVLVVAPMVDAGPPGMHCLGMQDTLQGFVNQVTTFAWLPDPALSSTNVLDPVVQAVGSHYFYLRGDTVIILNGNATTCSMTDSAWVAVTPALTPLPMPDDTVCRGTMLPLWVDSVHTVWWDSVPGILYGPGCSPCFQANATQVLTWHATDACECGTVSGQVTVTVPGLEPRADTVCHGDTLSLFAYGDLNSHYLWSPTGDTTQSILVSPLSDTDYIVQIDSAFGCYNISDTISVTVDTNCCFIPGAVVQRNARLSDLVVVNGSPQFMAVHWHIFDTLFVDTLASFQSSVFDMAPRAVVEVLPGRQLITRDCNFRAACGDTAWTSIRVEGPTANFKSSRDTFSGAENAVFSKGGGVVILDRGQFRSNYRHFMADTCQQFNQSVIISCLFSGGSPLPPFAQKPWPYCGVELREVAGIKIGSSTASAPNTFEGSEFGIFMQSSSANVEANLFRNLVNQGPFSLQGAGAAVYAKSGVLGPRLVFGALAQAGGMPLAPASNTVEDCPWGVFVNGTQHLEVYGNRFRRTARAALAVQQMVKNDLKVLKNNFEDCLGAVQMVLCRDVTGRLWENTVTGPANSRRNGFVFDGVWFSSSNFGPLLVENNDVSLLGDAFLVRNSDHVRVHMNDIYMKPIAGVASVPSYAIRLQGTKFCEVTENIIESDAANVPANRTWMRGIWVDSGPNSTVSCNEVKNFGWSIAFRSMCLDSKLRNNDIYNAVDGLLLVDDGRIGFQGGPNNPSGNKWIGQFFRGMTHSFFSNGTFSVMFAKNNQNPTIVTLPPPNNNFITGPVPPLLEFQFIPLSNTPPNNPNLCQQSNSNGNPTQNVSLAVQSQAQSLPWAVENQWKREYWAFETLSSDSVLAQSDTSYLSFLAAEAGGNKSKIHEAAYKLKAGSWSDALLIVSSIVSSNLVEENHTQVKLLQIHLETDPTSFGLQELQSLRSIAEMCPDDGGDAVWQARTLMLSLGEWIDGYDCNYQSAAKAGIQGAAETPWNDGLQVEVWPNPAASTLHFRVLKVEGAGETFVLYDIFGRELFSNEGIQGQEYMVPLDGISNGQYLWRASLPSGENRMGRVTIMR